MQCVSCREKERTRLKKEDTLNSKGLERIGIKAVVVIVVVVKIPV